MRFQAPKGTRDILPAEMYRWHKARRLFSDVCHMYGYEERSIPTFEDTNLFQRGVGDTTDVVQKEMYTFEDKGGRSITLRPEGTAGVCRSYIENGMGSLPGPVRLYYDITAFRYEKMAKGRFREFHQLGLEAFGSDLPEMDVEVISIINVFFKRAGLKKISLRINSIGCPNCRGAYNELLKEHFRPHVSTMCEDCQNRFEKNPLRMIDCKIDGEKDVVKNAPRLIDHLCEDCRAHFESVKAGLSSLGIEYKVDPNIVRGLDYYTKTVFEFVSENVGTQGTICGGGRYNGLVESLGGADAPGIGFAMGVERFLMEIEAQGVDFEKPDYVKIYLAGMSDEAKRFVTRKCYELRLAGIGCEQDLMGRSFRAQMKYAGKSGIPYMAVIGDDELSSGEVKVKCMEDGTETPVKFEDLTDFLAGK